VRARRTRGSDHRMVVADLTLMLPKTHDEAP
jgi:hypothetical protein